MLRSAKDGLRRRVRATYALSETHQTICVGIGSKLNRFGIRSSEDVSLQGKASKDHVVLHDGTGDRSRAIRDGELFTRILERRRRLRTEEDVLALLLVTGRSQENN